MRKRDIANIVMAASLPLIISTARAMYKNGMKELENANEIRESSELYDKWLPCDGVDNEYAASMYDWKNNAVLETAAYIHAISQLEGGPEGGKKWDVNSYSYGPFQIKLINAKDVNNHYNLIPNASDEELIDAISHFSTAVQFAQGALNLAKERGTPLDAILGHYNTGHNAGNTDYNERGMNLVESVLNGQSNIDDRITYNLNDDLLL